jgi:type I restriction enzyme S subunit
MSVLPAGWEKLRLGEIAARTSAIDPSRTPKEIFELYSVPAFASGTPDKARGQEIKSSKQSVQPDDVLLCKIVPHINRVWTVAPNQGERQIASGEWIVYRGHHCEPNYLRYLLSEASFREQFMTTVSGVGGSLMRARPSAVAEIEIPVAPLSEQRRIVAKIDSLSATSKRSRDNLDHIPRLVDKYKQAILAAAFSGQLTLEWRSARMLQEARPARLGELLAAPIRNGLSVRGSETPPGVRALRLSALRGEMVDLSDVRYLPISEDRAERYLLKEGDVLVSRGNGTKAYVGRAALVGPLPKPTIFPDTAFRLRLNEAVARPAWIARIWNAEPMRRQIELAARTTAGIWKISQADLNQLELILPCPSEQDEISNQLDRMLSCIDRLATEATSARKLIDHLDQAVLAKAFRGELVAQDPNDEPAGVLLDRILSERAAAGPRSHQKKVRRTR